MQLALPPNHVAVRDTGVASYSRVGKGCVRRDVRGDQMGDHMAVDPLHLDRDLFRLQCVAAQTDSRVIDEQPAVRRRH